MGSPEPAGATWPDLLTSLLQSRDLSTEQAAWAMDQVMAGVASPVQLAGFLVALRAKGETVDELRGLADVMLSYANRIEVPGPSLDIVGTGGDRSHSVNISTMSAVVIAGCGLRVVKHGNRAASSSSGSADVLEQLGVDLTLPPERVAEVAGEAGITFCFAQAFHPSMRHAAAARSGLGVGTVFNVLGPLTNPAQPTYAVIGVADQRMGPLMAGVFAGRGTQAVVFRGDDGLDELTLATTSTVWWVSDGEVVELALDPADVGMERRPLESLRGGDAAFNADVARRVFAGEQSPAREAVLLNAGMALTRAAAGEAGAPAPRTSAELAQLLREGMARAAESLDTGAAREALDRWVAATRA